eukprot:2734294-Karenia_brevis.AAC.1
MVVAESGLECDGAVKKAVKVPLMRNIRPVEPGDSIIVFKKKVVKKKMVEHLSEVHPERSSSG